MKRIANILSEKLTPSEVRDLQRVALANADNLPEDCQPLANLRLVDACDENRTPRLTELGRNVVLELSGSNINAAR